MRKIKRNRYRSIYSTKRRGRGAFALKVVVGVVLIAAMVFLGYSIADPLLKLFSGKWVVPSSSAPASSESSSALTSSSKASQSQSSSAVTTGGAVRGAYLPASFLSDSAALQSFITQAKAAGINLAVIDLKAENGVVNYASKVQSAKNNVKSNAPDAAAAAAALSNAGITPAARICAFRDPVAPKTLRGTGVMYSKNHEMNWLDSAGDRWLNPNNPTAQKYIEDLAVEAVSLGYKQIFVDAVTFPTLGYPDSTGYFGEMTSKQDVLTGFVAALKSQVNTAGGKLTVMTTGASAVGQQTDKTGQPADIFTLQGDAVSPNFCPSLLTASSISVGTETVTKPDLTPGDTVSKLAQYLKTRNSAGAASAVPFIQAYTNTKLGNGKYKTYTADDIKAEISALTGAGIDGYVLYSPKGDYDFSALK